ncbi:MAG: BPSS1187 family protein [Opitutia bacterium]
MRPALACLFLGLAAAFAADAAPKFADPKPQAYHLTARASELDPRCKSHPEVGFVLEKDGKPQDVQHADVDTRVAPRGQLVIWLMGYSQPLADKVNGYGLHHIQVAYAREWFGKLNTEPADDPQHLGNIRLEATTGVDASKAIDIPAPDSMKERAFQFVKHLAKTHPQGRWEQFLAKDGQGLDWEKVIISGASHGATSSARFAIAQKVARVVMFCGPRDQLDTWQGLPSATPANRFFGYSHVLDGGWAGDHYPRSWLLLGLNKFGPIVNTDETKAPFGHSRRLITKFDVKGDANKAHGFVQVSKNPPKDAKGVPLQEEVWRYLFTSPVEEVGAPVPAEPETRMNLRASPKKK